MNLVERIIYNFRPEDRAQYEVVTWCEAQGLAIFHVPNSTWTKSIMVRTRNGLLGVRAGVPDLWIIIPGVCLLVIEMKQAKVPGKHANYPTAAQREWLKRLNDIPNIVAAACYGSAEAIKLVQSLMPITMPKETTTNEVF